jgi:hypothetical protein
MSDAKHTSFTFPRAFRPLDAIRDGVAARRPVIYICIVLIAAAGALMYELRTRTIFACQADGYGPDRYLAYCGGDTYADYEHGALYFDLEPSAESFVQNADVLFLGNSRLQVAFSTDSTAQWFSSAATRYYLLGFSYFENALFAQTLLNKIKPHAAVYVINLDGFFDPSETIPAKGILHDTDARHKYEVKRNWQRVHQPICEAIPQLCGSKFVIYRSRETGAYYAFQTEGAAEQKVTPVSYNPVADRNAVNGNTTSAIDFLSRFTKEKCVILTMVPFVGTTIGDATAIASALGMELVMPGPLEGLTTFDGYHLDRSSAERWSQAFFQAAGPKIRSCLGKEDIAHP